MTTLDQDDCRTQMVHLLNEELAALGLLEQALAAELAAISARDTTAIEHVLTEKLQGLEKMEALNRKRLALVESCGFQPDKDGMHTCLKWCDTGRTLQVLWQKVLTLAGKCRDGNLLNHHLVELGSRQMHQALCIIRGEDPDKALYNTLGNAYDSHDRRTLARV